MFSYKQFYICDLDGNVVADVTLPNTEEVYDQQFIRKGNESYLEVIYRDGKVLTYDVRNGSFLSESTVEKPNLSLNEEFYTEDFRI